MLRIFAPNSILRKYKVTITRTLQILDLGYSIKKLLYKSGNKRNPVSVFQLSPNDKNALAQSLKPSFKDTFEFKRVFLYWPKNVVRSNNLMQSDIDFLYTNSLKELDIFVTTIEPLLNIDAVRLVEFIGKPNLESSILFFDGNAFETYSDTDLDQIRNLRSQGLILIVDHPDLLNSRNGILKLEHQLKYVDYAVIHNPNLIANEKISKRVLLWPTFPFPLICGKVNNQVRNSEVLFAGGEYRGNRDIFAKYLKFKKIPVKQRLHSANNPENKSLDYLDYLSTFEFSTMAFTNGYRSNKESLLAFRVFELILKETLVFYERGSWIDTFLSPYIHYIPVSSAPDLADKAKSIMENPSIISRITNDAKTFVQEKYSGKIFWSQLNKMIIND